MLPVHDQRQHQDRRRHGARVPRRRRAEGHGVRPVPPDGAARHRHPDHRGLARRGRLPAEQRGRALPGDARLRRRREGGARPARHDLAREILRDRGGPRHRRARTASTCISTCATSGEEKIDGASCRSCASSRSTYVGVDPVHEPIPIRPVVHYMMGGVDTDIDGATTLPGLYAAGETACVSMNGANRLGSNSLTECLVFGARAGMRRRARSRRARRGRQRSALRGEAETEERAHRRAARPKQRRREDVRDPPRDEARDGARLRRLPRAGLDERRRSRELAQLKGRYADLVLEDSEQGLQHRAAPGARARQHARRRRDDRDRRAQRGASRAAPTRAATSRRATTPSSCTTRWCSSRRPDRGSRRSP